MKLSKTWLQCLGLSAKHADAVMDAHNSEVAEITSAAAAAALGSKGGSRNTEAQKAARKENGKKGGRPKGGHIWEIRRGWNEANSWAIQIGSALGQGFQRDEYLTIESARRAAMELGLTKWTEHWTDFSGPPTSKSRVVTAEEIRDAVN